MTHFGVTVRKGKKQLNLIREEYAIINPRNSLPKFEFLAEQNAYADEEGRFYTDEWCTLQREKCLRNFDLNMRFFSSLNHNVFEESLNEFLKKYSRAKQIFDLNDVDGISGCYIMVLDKYCQAYVGCSNNIRKRIQSHWTGNKAFDRLLFPMGAVNSSVLSIDSFRALDTTRIFVYEGASSYKDEESIINFFPKDFLLNRICGGRILDGLAGYMQVSQSIKHRDLGSTN